MITIAMGRHKNLGRLSQSMTGDIKGLLKKLKGKDADERREAANALGDAAQKGKDISAASGALEAALSDENRMARVRVAWALANHMLQKGRAKDLAALYDHGGSEVRNGIAQALVFWTIKDTDISPLVPLLEKDLKEPSLKHGVASALAYSYVHKGLDKGYAKLLKDNDPLVRLSAAAACRSAASESQDISPFLQALRKSLGDSDGSVARAAADALATYHGKRREWKEIDNLLTHRNENVRYSTAETLYGFAEALDIPRDVPNLLKALGDKDGMVGKGALAVIRHAAEKGKDIAFAVPMLKRLEMNPRMKEAAGLALKTYELRKDAGKRCQSCLDCELGRRPGDESKSLEDLASIVKEIACCGGEVTHVIFRCRKCGKYYASSYYDHTGFEEEQFFIKEISKKDAEKAMKELKKCKNPDDEDCKCDVHKKYLKGDDLPVKGTLKYSVTI